jgi:hypothetical protein
VNLKDALTTFSNDYLVEQLFLHSEQYTEEARKLMKEEILRRGISEADVDSFISSKKGKHEEDEHVINYDKSDLTKIEGGFNTNDSLIVRSMLSEQKIPFVMDASTGILPFNGESLDTHLIDFLIHKNFFDKASTAINEHFDLVDGRYILKYSDIKTRLKSFNFYEIPRTLIESSELTEVDFSQKEKEIIIRYGTKVVDEVDDIEKKQERAVFYYDTWEDLLEKFKNEDHPELSHTDLLATLEALQIFCDETDFPPEAENIADSLIKFFSSMGTA